MPTFKAGDKVRVVNLGTVHDIKLSTDDRNFLGAAGTVHTVARPNASGSCVFLEGRNWGYYTDRFELVQPEKPRQFLFYDGYVVGGKTFDTAQAAEDFLLENGGAGATYNLVELVPVKTVKVRRVIEEVTE